MSVAWTAVNFPALVAPILTFMWVPEVGPVPMNTSVRLIAILTGRPVLRDRMATTGSR